MSQENKKHVKTAVAGGVAQAHAGENAAKDVYRDYTPMQLRAHLRKAEALIIRQENIGKAGKACARLMQTPDFQVVTAHLRDTVTQLALDAPQRHSAEHRAQDHAIMQSVAVVLDMLTTLPEVGESMDTRVHETRAAVVAIKSKL